jgi:aminoglycoside/choline kinase family phosphotransferase
MVMRDFHADNLMWLPDRRGIAACGLLDFQDAVVGPPCYDLMSLLDDARRDLLPGLTGRMLDRYLDAFPEYDKAEFRATYAALAAQRHCKVIGIFTRLAERDAKYGYLVHIPRVWRLLDLACRHPYLGPLKTWLDDHIPLANRQVPIHRKQA